MTSVPPPSDMMIQRLHDQWIETNLVHEDGFFVSTVPNLQAKSYIKSVHVIRTSNQTDVGSSLPPCIDHFVPTAMPARPLRQQHQASPSSPLFNHCIPFYDMSFVQYRGRAQNGHARAFLPFPPPSTPHTNHSQSTCSFSPAPSRPNHPHPTRHTTAINKYAKAGNLPQLQNAIHNAALDGYVLNAVNYTTIANAHADHGSPEQVFNVLAMMRKRRVRPTIVTLRVAVKACQRWRNSHRVVESIMETLRWVVSSRVEPCLRSWNMALSCLAKQNAHSNIDEIIRWMHAGNNVPRPDTRSYNLLMSSYKRPSNLVEAVHVFRRMVVGGPRLRPDVVTYNTLLDIAVHADLPHLSEDDDKAPNRFVDAILRSLTRQKVKSNLTTETLILRVLCRKDGYPDPQLMWERFANLRADKWMRLDKQYLDAALTGFGRAADINGMSVAMTEMTERRLKPDSATFQALLRGASHLGDVSLAQGILNILSSNGIVPNAYDYTTAISSCARADPCDPVSAEAMLRQALEQGIHWTPAMVNAAISSIGDDCSKAIRMWQKLRSCPDRMSRDALNERMVYDALMRVCGRQARPDVALRIFYAARKAGHVRSNTAESRSLYGAFRRGSREAGLEEDVDKNALKVPFMHHLKAECGVNRDLDLFVERIRIRL